MKYLVIILAILSSAPAVADDSSVMGQRKCQIAQTC